MKKDGLEKWVWKQDPETFSSQQKSRLIAKVVEIIAKTMFNTHMYV